MMTYKDWIAILGLVIFAFYLIKEPMYHYLFEKTKEVKDSETKKEY